MPGRARTLPEAASARGARPQLGRMRFGSIEILLDSKVSARAGASGDRARPVTTVVSSPDRSARAWRLCRARRPRRSPARQPVGVYVQNGCMDIILLHMK